MFALAVAVAAGLGAVTTLIAAASSSRLFFFFLRSSMAGFVVNCSIQSVAYYEEGRSGIAHNRLARRLCQTVENSKSAGGQTDAGVCIIHIRQFSDFQCKGIS